jgi:hypothetical protein
MVIALTEMPLARAICLFLPAARMARAELGAKEEVEEDHHEGDDRPDDDESC